MPSSTERASPAPSEIKAARKAADLTQTEAAELVHSTLRSWQDWEYGKYPIHAGLWELFLIKTKGSACTPE
jgi:putative transcriptional regulator